MLESCSNSMQHSLSPSPPIWFPHFPFQILIQPIENAIIVASPPAQSFNDIEHSLVTSWKGRRGREGDTTYDNAEGIPNVTRENGQERKLERLWARSAEFGGVVREARGHAQMTSAEGGAGCRPNSDQRKGGCKVVLYTYT